MIYILLVNVALVLFYLLYRFGLKRLTFFRLNRIYLNSILLFSLVLPIGMYLQYEVPDAMIVQIPEIVYQLNPEKTSTVIKDSTSAWTIAEYLTIIYWIGVCLGLIKLGHSLWKIKRRIDSPDKNDSFSFFGKIVMGEKVQGNDVMEQHESIHVREGHAYDLLLLDIVTLFNWFNPVCYLLRKDLKLLHECLVDQNFKKDRVQYAELLLAYAMRTDTSSLSYEFSNQSFLKERINMLFKENSKSNTLFIYLSVLPIVLLLMTISVNCKENVEQSIASESNVLATALAKLPGISVAEGIASTDTIKPKENKKESTAPINIKLKGKANTLAVAQSSDKEESATGGNQARIVLKGKSSSEIVNYNDTDTPAQYPGGIKAFREQIVSKVEYPKEAIEVGVEGVIQLSFVIDPTGKVVDTKVDKDLGYGVGDAFIKVLDNSERWIPATVNGKPVSVKFSLPIRVDLHAK
ncbi:energy transducer TonB [Sphingobacterium kyonggiense]